MFKSLLSKSLFSYLFYLLSIFITLEIYSYFSIGYFSKYHFLQNAPIEFITITTIYTIYYIFLRHTYKYYIPILFLFSYISLDVASDIYNRYIDYSDLSNLYLLFDAMHHSKGDVIYLIFIFPLLLSYLAVTYKTLRLYVLATTVLILLVFQPFLSHNYLYPTYSMLYKKFATTTSYFWTPNKLDINYAKTGRISTFIYEGMLKKENYNNIKQYQTNQLEKLNIKIQDIKHLNIQKRNVYLIGLESFILPSQLKKLDFKYLNNDKNKTYDVVKYSSTMTTSIFGGGTIQSEFEALCGVPALQKISAFEFTEFVGSPTNCLPQILKALNYSTIVSNTFRPQPSFEALTSVGFQDINFPKEYFPNRKSYLKNDNITKGEYAIFDSDFYDQNLNYVKQNYIMQNKPIFNYMFSVWGHAMHDMLSSKRPIAIKITNANKYNLSQHSKLAINQDYYRIIALQKFFNRIKQQDPNALVIAYADHRTVLDGASSYKKYGFNKSVFENFVIIMNKGKYIHYDKPFPLYALPDIILNLLTNNNYCKQHICKTTIPNKEKFLDDYYEIMANAMNKNSKKSNFIIKENQKYFYYDENIPFIGFSQAERNHRWSDAKISKIFFTIKDKKVFKPHIVLSIATLAQQRLNIYLNDHLIFQKKLNLTSITPLNIKFNKKYLKENSLNELRFNLPDAHQPSKKDTRILAIKFKSIILKGY